MTGNNQVILDTTAAIRVQAGVEGMLQRINHYSDWLLPVPVCGELLFGAMKSSRTKENLRLVRRFMARCTVLPVTISTAEHYARIRLTLRQKGRPIPENDVWIAAFCVEHELPLATDDAHFRELDNLVIV